MFIPACDRSFLQLSHSITMFPLVLFCGLPVTTFSCSARCLGRVWAAAPTGRGARLSFLRQNLGKRDVPVGRPRTPWRGVNAPWWRNAPCGNDGVSRQSGPRVGACSSLGTASGCFCLLGRHDPGTRTEGKWRASEAYVRGRSDEAACVPAARLNQRGRDPRRDRSSAELRTFFLPHLSSSEWTTAAPLHRTGKQGAPVRSAWPRRMRGAKTQAALGLRARSPRLPQAPSLPHFTPCGAVPWRPP